MVSARARGRTETNTQRETDRMSGKVTVHNTLWLRVADEADDDLIISSMDGRITMRHAVLRHREQSAERGGEVRGRRGRGGGGGAEREEGGRGRGRMAGRLCLVHGRGWGWGWEGGVGLRRKG